MQIDNFKEHFNKIKSLIEKLTVEEFEFIKNDLQNYQPNCYSKPTKTKKAYL